VFVVIHSFYKHGLFLSIKVPIYSPTGHSINSKTLLHSICILFFYYFKIFSFFSKDVCEKYHSLFYRVIKAMID